LNRQLAGQISWLLPLAGLGFPAAGWQTRLRLPLTRRHQSLLLWGVWLLPMLIFFSFANLFHRYYLEMLAPAIATPSATASALMTVRKRFCARLRQARTFLEIGDWGLACRSLGCGLDQSGCAVLEQLPDSADGLGQFLLLAARQQESQLLLL